jgi:hypothetical protein
MPEIPLLRRQRLGGSRFEASQEKRETIREEMLLLYI